MNKETLEEAAKIRYGSDQFLWAKKRDAFIEGAKWLQKRMYSEEEVFNLLMEFSLRDRNSYSETPHSIAKWFEQFKKK